MLPIPLLARAKSALLVAFVAMLSPERAALAVVVDAGPPLAAPVASPVALGASVSGLAPLDFLIADGDDLGANLFENDLVFYDDVNGLSSIGEIHDPTTGFVFGWPSGLVRDGAGTTYGVDTFHEQVFIVDETTALVTPLGPPAGQSTWDTRMGAMVDDGTGTGFYVIDFQGGADRLWHFDIATTSWTIVRGGLPSADARGLVRDPSTGLLWVYDAGTNRIYALNPATGGNLDLVTPVLDPGPAFASATLLDLYFDDIALMNGDVYGTLRIVEDVGPFLIDHAQIHRIDMTTGITTQVGPTISGSDAHSFLLNSVPERLQWSVDSGPGAVAFDDDSDPATNATFDTPGSYVLRLTAFATPPVFDTVTVTVGAACANGLDDDGDGLVDFGSDPGCTAADDGDETEPSLACDNGLDDDGDGAIDFGSDPGCADPAAPTESPACQNGLDDDGDGFVDFDGGASVLGAGAPGLTAPDGSCQGDASHVRERNQACGLGGADLLFVFPAWVAFRRARAYSTR